MDGILNKIINLDNQAKNKIIQKYKNYICGKNSFKGGSRNES